MNLNYNAVIKQEFPNSEEDFVNSHLKVSVKNEPITDEASQFLTIKSETISEATLIESGVKIKTENQLEKETLEPADSFIIYELETPTSTLTSTTQGLQNVQQIFKEPPQIQALSVAQINQMTVNKNPVLKPHLQQLPVTNKMINTVTTAAVPSAPPVLLNSQLRKRHKVVLPLNPIDKRTRYNIEGTTTILLTSKSTTASNKNSAKILNKCRSQNTGIKKVINHLIKQKRNQSKQKDSPTILENFSSQGSAEKSVTLNCREQSLSPVSLTHIEQSTSTTQTELNASCSPSLSEIALSLPKETKDPPFTPELRVKCLCSLTADSSDTSTDNSELRAFFQEMFEETRRLDKKQQRKVKMSLLQAISGAEDLMEQGKCCGF